MAEVFIGIATVPERASYLHDVRHAMATLLPPGLRIETASDYEHRGVAWNKNRLLRSGIDSGADWIFISEDDIVVQDPQAVSGYIRAAELSGIEHLAFAHHGPANQVPVEKSPIVTIWPAYVGAWCLYSRHCLEVCGLLDEAFVNSWEHVEHTLRLSLAGFHPLPSEPYKLRAADATGSEHWLHEIPGSIENTTIPHTNQWKVDRARGREHWKRTYPRSYALVFGR